MVACGDQIWMKSTGLRWDHGAHLIGRWAIAMVKAYSTKGGAGFLGGLYGII